MPLLSVHNIRCRYDTVDVISDLSFELQPGQIACLLGPSGCGKTTALRAIAGFEPVRAGSISLGDRLFSDRSTTLPPELRQVGMVFQDYALFPHLTVRANIGFALNKKPAAEREATVNELLALVKLQDHADAWPHQLSGGQQQRVALARALAPSPGLLLLDEPFSNLDTELRRSLSLEVRSILKSRGISAILVTHDRTEAFNMADEIGVMQAGRISQWGTPQTLYHAPANAWVANFICDGRFLAATSLGDGRLMTCFGELLNEAVTGASGTSYLILVRPWEVTKTETGVSARIVQQQFLGALSLTTLELADGSLIDSSDEQFTGLHPEDSVCLALSRPELLVFPA